jgi:hypothetical protein
LTLAIDGDPNATRRGGGIYWRVPTSTRRIHLINNTIADNVSPAGSGVFAVGVMETPL